MMKVVFKIYIPYLIVMIAVFVMLTYTDMVSKFSSIALEYFCIFTSLFVFKKNYRGIIWTLVVGILGAQISSLYTSGNYVIPLTLSNVGEYNALGFELLFKLLCISLLFLCVAQIIFSPVFTYDIPRRKTFLLALLFLPLINGPLVKFTETLYFYYKQVTFSPAYNYPAIAKKFLKTDIWYDESLLLKNKKPNVIVIFTEGMSFNVIDSVNNLGLGVTPKLDEIMKKSFFFINYYNHTAATFRGLRGQLTSAYQFKDGVGANGDGFFEITNQKVKSIYNKRLVSLPEILNSNGYKTIFLSSTEKTSTLNAMLKTLSFNEVLGMGDFDFYQNDRMSDKQTFIALKEVVERNKNNKFFIGVYPSGTHHGLDSPDLRFRDGSNSYYNKFYNFDHQVGKFIDYLTSTGLINNTLVVITADHSTFPTPQFNKSFSSNSDYFVDAIPLIILGAGIESKKNNAHGKNSLALAPTILNLLNINHYPNFFLGCSLLDVKCQSTFSHISAIGNSFFKTGDKKCSSDDYNVKKLDNSSDIIYFYNVSG